MSVLGRRDYVSLMVNESRRPEPCMLMWCVSDLVWEAGMLDVFHVVSAKTEILRPEILAALAWGFDS